MMEGSYSLPEPDYRIVLVGKTGVGKSATGNTMLRRRAFESKSSPSSLTTVCRKEIGEFEGQTLAVVDTPGLFDTVKSQMEVSREIARCISFAAPGPHVFLVVIQPNRFTEEEQKTVKLIQKLFGEQAGCYTMVLFTRGDDLEEDGVSIDEFIQKSSPLQAFVKQCGGGHHIFNNRNKDPTQFKELLEKINDMVQKNGGKYYTNEMLEEAERAIREEAERLQQENPDMKPEDARKKAEEDNNLIKTFTRIGAGVGGALGPAGAVIGATIGAAVGTVLEAMSEKNCVIQ